MNIERTVAVRGLPFRKASERMKKWHHPPVIPTKEIEGRVLVSIGFDFSKSHWVLDHKLGGRKNIYAMCSVLTWMVFGSPSYVAFGTRSVNYISTGDIG